jgi:hypothetical protein
MKTKENENAARVLADAIRTIASKPANIDNLELYLSYHFDKWLEKFANTPEKLAGELKQFSEMDI